MRMTRPTWVRLCVVVALASAALGLSAAPSGAFPAFHGITPRKACNTTTKIGDPYVCAFQIINADDNNEDIVVTSLIDVVHAASGNVSSGNIMGGVTWTPSGGASCTGTPVTSCKLPNKGDAITSADFTFYTVQPGDYSQNPQHILADDIAIAWSEPVCAQGGCPVGGQTGTTGASTTVLNFKPTINTQLVPAGPVAIGTPVHDTSSLTGASPTAGGTVSYAVYSNNTCTTLVQALGTKTVTNGVVPDSNVWTPNAAGNFWFQASYSGDASNDPAISPCTSEPITVSPNTPSINTVLVPAGPVAIGTPIHDTSTLVGATANAGGSVTYAVYSNNTCTTLVQGLGTKTVTNGIVPDSDTYTPQSAGNLWFQATYSGDANNTGPVSSACLSEPMTVSPNMPSINTQLVPAGPVAIGTPVHDTSTLVGATANAGGTVSYAVFSNSTCTTLVQALGTKTVTNGVVPDSDVWTPNAAGNFWFQATYSGDANNAGPVSSPCTSEPITVSPNTPSVTTQLVPAGPVAIGTPVHDTAQLQNVTANAGGTVSYAVYSNNTCTTLVQALGTKTVTNGVVPDSDVWTAGPPGNYWFQATYSGDANNQGPVKSACTSEPITVNGNNPLHFQCYETKTTGFAPKTVTVTDQFGSYSPVLSQLHKLCNPANKNNEDPNAVNADTHLDGYPARAKDSPGGGHRVQTTDQFGTITLTLAQLKTVMVPSAKSLVAPPGPLASPAVDRLACYVVRSAAGFTARKNVKVQDEFGTLTLNVGPVDEYCNPINLNGKEPGAQTHTTTYVCYDTDIPTGLPAFKPPANVWVNDEFQAFKPVLDGHVWELCVPGTSKVVG